MVPSSQAGRAGTATEDALVTCVGTTMERNEQTKAVPLVCSARAIGGATQVHCLLSRVVAM